MGIDTSVRSTHTHTHTFEGKLLMTAVWVIEFIRKKVAVYQNDLGKGEGVNCLKCGVEHCTRMKFHQFFLPVAPFVAQRLPLDNGVRFQARACGTQEMHCTNCLSGCFICTQCAECPGFS